MVYLRALSRLLLPADTLATLFGPQGRVAPQVVSGLVDALVNWAGGPRVGAFLSEWRRLFGIVYGEHFAAHQVEAVHRLASLYRVPPQTDFQSLLFAVHTYFVLLMKLIAAELLTISETSLMSSFSADLANSAREDFVSKLRDVEDGGVFQKRGVTNFLEGDFFRWYLAPFLRDWKRHSAKWPGCLRSLSRRPGTWFRARTVTS